MITALEFIQGGLKQLHSNLDKQLSNITSEATRGAVALAEMIGGVVDSHTSL